MMRLALHLPVLAILAFAPAASAALANGISLSNPSTVASATSGVTYLVSEGAEGTGTPAGWTDAGAIDWDSTTSPIQGVQSLVSPAFADDSWVGFTGQSAFSLFLAYRVSLLSATPNVFYVEDSGGAQQIRCRIISDGAIRIIDPDGGIRATSAAGVVSAGTVAYIWVDGTKGTGTNAALTVYVAATTTKPGSATLSISDGEWATDVARLRLRGVGTSGTTTEWDYVRLQSGSGTIGSAPP